MDELEEILQRCFHVEEFRPGQRAAIETILSGRDVLAIWPTGAGKSLVYQMASQLLPHLTLVVTPLVSLLFDQVRRLHQMGFSNAACLSSAQHPAENARALEALRLGQLKILFLTPERLNSEAFLARLRGTPISLLTIDEAHCICQWGHDFRPDYLNLGRAINVLQPRSILAMTATATTAAQEQISRLLGLQNPAFIRLSLDRPNLHYSALEVPRLQARDVALQHLLRRQGLPAIIYINQRQECENTAIYLRQQGLRADFYHASLPPEVRHSVQQRFLEGELQVIAATTAFGMGVDKPDVRQVIHLTPSNSLEEYYQESGRAGRDRQEAHCLLLYSPSSFELAWKQLEHKYPSEEQLGEIYEALSRRSPRQLRADFLSLNPAGWRLSLNAILGYAHREDEVSQPMRSLEGVRAYLNYLQQQERQRLQAMQSYAYSQNCRRRALLGYFGEEVDYCSGCDRCLPPSPWKKPSPLQRLWRLLNRAGETMEPILAAGI